MVLIQTVGTVQAVHDLHNISARRLADCGQRLFGQERCVRRHHDLRQVLQHLELGIPPLHSLPSALIREVCEEQRLLILVDVHSHSAYSTGPVHQHLHEALRVNQPSPGHIYEDGVVLHLRQTVPAYNMLRRRQQRRVERDDVRLGQEPVHLDVLGASLPRLLARKQVVRQYFPAESRQQFDHGCTDCAGADHTKRLARQLGPNQTIQRIVPHRNLETRQSQVPRRREHQAQPGFGHRLWRVGRNPCHRDPQVLCRLEINAVVAGAAVRHHPHAHLAQGLQDTRIALVVHKVANHVVAGCKACG
mmetsp:Transcript_110/g.291  ORF Transcript_110/g.291 Transcript_110/m.291 type:complete len:304 (-) Transcript_110:278-1189(-)